MNTSIDERSAAFLALGMATAKGLAVAVVTTSGTAVANLLPAAVEADRSAQPLLFLTADRPFRLKECGANQTVNQEHFLRPVCRWCGTSALEGIHTQNSEELSLLCAEIWRHAHGLSDAAPGPVHLNLPFEEPLHASSFDQIDLTNFVPKHCYLNVEMSASLLAPPSFASNKPGVVIAGPWRGLAGSLQGYQLAVEKWLKVSGWHLLADPLSALPMDLPQRVVHWDLLLESLPIPAGMQVLRLGPLPVSRRIESWLKKVGGSQLVVSEGDPRYLDPLGIARQWSGGMAAWVDEQQFFSSATLIDWTRLDSSVEISLSSHLPVEGPVSEPALARALGSLLPDNLPVMLAASSPVRDWLSWSEKGGINRRCFSFRGASGIDGTLSLAMGLSIELGRLVLISGDLAMLHDSNGWLYNQQCASLLVILIDNNGGGIFQQLPIENQSSEFFDNFFTMPQQVNHIALAGAHSVPGREIACLEDLPGAIEWGLAQQGTALLRVCTDRRADAALRSRMLTSLQKLFP